MSKRLTSLIELQPERVCILKPSSLGDIVHALPVLSSLRALGRPRESLGWSIADSCLCWKDIPNWTKSFRSTAIESGRALAESSLSLAFSRR